MRNIFRSFWMTMKRFRVPSSLNVLGMAVAFAAVYVIAVQIYHDWFYNHGLTDSERIYRVEIKKGRYSTASNRPIPENCINNIASVDYCGGGNFLLENVYDECEVINNGEIERNYVKEKKLVIFDFSLFDFGSNHFFDGCF